MSPITPSPVDYSHLPFDPLSERIVDAICDKVNTTERSFFRVHTAYYLATLASMMRTSFQLPGQDAEPVNLFAVNLAPSGFGKGYSTSILEDNVIQQFRQTFVDHTFPLAARTHLPTIAVKRAARKIAADPDDELERVEKEFDSLGALMFSFDKPTPPALKQMRTMLLMANAGAMNIQVDEIGNNLAGIRDALILICELYNGKAKANLTKNTADSKRMEDLQGITPTNLMLFGEPSSLLDGARVEDDFTALLQSGFARRCFFGFVPESVVSEMEFLSPDELLAKALQGTSNNTLQSVADHLERLADFVNMGKVLTVGNDAAKCYFSYQIECRRRSLGYREHEHLFRYETGNRFAKAVRLAGAYAFFDESPEITVSHMESAIALAEESGESFRRIVQRERSYVKVAKYLADSPEEVTQTELSEDLGSVFKGPRGQKEEIITQAIAWGYRNNIIVRRRFSDGVDFLRGETLKSTDLSRMIIAYSSDITRGYLSEEVGFDQLHRLVSAPAMHWVNHHLREGYRDDDHCLPGFNLCVIDVDDGMPLSMARRLLDGYRALYYTTKSHTPENPRFRILLPTNYVLALEKDDFAGFMKNLYEWLPFDCDEQTNQRSRKWRTHAPPENATSAGHLYTPGQLLDVLPFIPKTTKNEERRRQAVDLGNLGAIERWVLQNIGEGSRNNQLLRYALILVDGGASTDEVRGRVFGMNDRLADKLEEAEIMSSIMVTATKAIARRDAPV